MRNAAFAEVLLEMASLLELSGGNTFKIRALQKSAHLIQGLPQDISDMDRQTLMALPGVGGGIADKVLEFVQSGTVAERDALRQQVPGGLMDLVKVPGLGPKRARVVYDRLQVHSLTALEKAARAGRLALLPGFGETLEQHILEGIKVVMAGKRFLLWEARRWMGLLLPLFRALPSVERAEIAGSLRRGCETVEQLELVVSASDPAPALTALTHHPRVTRVLAQGEDQVRVLLDGVVPCELRVVAPENFGIRWWLLTGSGAHNQALLNHAQGLGFTLNESGLFRRTNAAQKTPLTCREETQLCQALGLAWIPPELRENRGEIARAAQGDLPTLVEEKDIQGCFHNHTLESDGSNTLEEMVAAARARGWTWFVSGDHSPGLTVAHGLSWERLEKKIEQVRRLDQSQDGIRVKIGSEVDIRSDGSMDYPDDVLRELDVVVGSIHSGFTQPGEKITRRILAAMDHPEVDCIGHLSGRLLGRRPPYPFDWDEVLEASARTGTALEINGQPDRQDITDVQARAAVDRGVPLAVNTDAHSTDQLGYMSTAVTVARRAGLTAKDLLNTRSWEELAAWLKT